ncbi:PepSY-associated TM helix domain-containing protein [Baia soyae]|uniref:Putative iron-regulated membrane protein n=1 Tax=Baia soyae TaxID=1544746 RepID=A0A4R2RDX3_9BACL|nr:PepSY domain-containing protein [Baia soyae]TCP61003.1 putative iron-regulated membrane protein [Baia soyae]
MKKLEESQSIDQGQSSYSQKTIYRSIWRWHFYAGIIFAPLLIMLALTGALYLFKPQIEGYLYQDYYQVKAGAKALTPSEQIGKVEKQYPGATIKSFRPGEESTRSTEVEIINQNSSSTIFVDPYNGKILGSLSKEDRFFSIVEKLHGELMIGDIGDRLVELTACWAIILIITGLYLWWPRDRKSIYGTIIPRFRRGRQGWRDWHSVTGFWLSSFIVLLVFTGLPWSGVWGETINKIATSTQTGYPKGLWDGAPQSTIPTKDVAEVSWAAENMPVPNSNQRNGYSALSVEQVIKIANEKKVHSGYVVNFPQGEKGVYTVSVSPPSPEDQATLHIDQYNGKVLADLRFTDYGIMAKAISIGIALHEGRYFGIGNQLIGLITCLGLVGITIAGMVMWWKRRPKGKFGAPSRVPNQKMLKSIAVIVVLLGIFLPLAGISILFVLLLDWLVIKRVRALREFFGE